MQNNLIIAHNGQTTLEISTEIGLIGKMIMEEEIGIEPITFIEITIMVLLEDLEIDLD